MQRSFEPRKDVYRGGTRSGASRKAGGPAPAGLAALHALGQDPPEAVLTALLRGATPALLLRRLRLLRSGTHGEDFTRFLRGLPRGPAHKHALSRLFFAAAEEGPPAEGGAVLEARFDLSLSGGTVPWCWPTLRRLWEVLAVLPESAVAENPDFCRLARVDSGDGSGVYHDRHTRSPLGPRSVEVGVERLWAMSPEYRLPLDHFSSTVRHEVGHAVATQLGLHDTLYTALPHSPWAFQGDRRNFLLRLLGATGGGEGDDPRVYRLCELYLHQPAGRTRSLHRAFQALKEEEQRAGRRAPSSSLLKLLPVRVLGQNCRHKVPCYHALAPMPDGLIYYYDPGYRRGFACSERLQKRTWISAYQFRAPNEWFAELYVVYYADCDRQVPPGQSLRRMSRSLRDIADWLDAHVHRQARTGAGGTRGGLTR